MHCQNENKKLQTIIDLQNLQNEFKDEIFGPKKTNGRFFAQIDKLKHLYQKSQNQGIKKEVDNNKAKEELTHLNALLNDKDEEIAKVQRKLESQETEICRHQQQMKELQHKYNDIRRAHKLENIFR